MPGLVNRFWRGSLLLCCLVWLTVNAAAQEVLLNADGKIGLENKISYWVDEAGTTASASPDAVLLAAGRISDPLTSPNLGHTKGALWLKLVILNAGPDTVRVLQVAPVHSVHVEAWLLKSGTSEKSEGSLHLGQVAGEAPTLLQPLNSINAAFTLNLISGRSSVVLRLKSISSMVPELSLWQPSAWTQMNRLTDWRGGIETGALAFAALVSLSFAFWLREPAWFWHGLTNIGLIIYLALHSGADALWLFRIGTEWTTAVMLSGLSLSIVSAALFFVSFLEAPFMPRWGRWALLGLAAISVCSTVLSLTLDYPMWIGLQYVAGMVMPTMIVMLSAMAWPLAARWWCWARLFVTP